MRARGKGGSRTVAVDGDAVRAQLRAERLPHGVHGTQVVAFHEEQRRVRDAFHRVAVVRRALRDQGAYTATLPLLPDARDR